MARWPRVAAVVLPLLLLALFAAPGAGAAPGDPVATVALPLTSSGVSIAFDGHYLYWTTDADGDTILHRIAPSGDPSTYFEVPIVGAPGIDAFSYDATRDRFWGAGTDGYTIYLIDKNGVATP